MSFDTNAGSNKINRNIRPDHLIFMGQWTIPEKYRIISNSVIFPYIYENRNSDIKLLENNGTIQKLLNIIRFISHYSTASIPFKGDNKEDCRIAYIVNGKNLMVLAISYLVYESVGYPFSFGPILPSTVFNEHSVPNINSIGEAEKYATELYDLNGKFRAIFHDWYWTFSTTTDYCIDSFWFNTRNSTWMRDLESVVKLKFK